MTTHANTSLGKIIPFMLDNIPIRGMILRVEGLERCMPSFQHKGEIHTLLTELLLSSAVLVQDLKKEAHITAQIQSESDVPLLVAQCHKGGDFRAYAQPKEGVDLQQITYESIVQKSLFSVHIKQEGQTQVHQSIVPLNTSSVASSLETYFTKSVQIPTYFRVFHDESQRSSVAFLLQYMPQEALSEDDWKRLHFLLETVHASEICSKKEDLTAFLARFFAEDTVRVFNEKSLSFSMASLKGRMADALRSMGVSSVKDLLKEGAVEMKDAFSGQTVSFTEKDMVDIFGTQWQEECTQ